MRNRCLILALLSLLPCDAPGADLFIAAQNFTTGNLNRRITLTPQADVSLGSTNFFAGGSAIYQPTNGILWVSNIVENTYRMTFEGLTGSVFLEVPATNGAVNAVSIATTTSAAAGGIAFSKAASDARYLVPEVVTPPDGIEPPWTIYRVAGGYKSGVNLATLNADRAVTLYVATTGDDGDDGLTWATAKQTLAAAAAASPGETKRVYVAPGTYDSALVTFTNHVSLLSTGGVVTLGPVLAHNYSDLYAQGLDFDGGIGWLTAAASNRFTCVDSRFYGSVSNGVNVRVNAGQTYLLRCSMFTNTLDGANYHWDEGPTVTAWALEENCTGYGNGSGLSDNGSTGHDGWWVLRIGGAYWGNSAYNVIDIGNGGSWNIGVKAGGSFGANNWAFASGYATDTTRMVIEDCQQIGSGGWIKALTGLVSIEEIRPVAPPISSSGTSGNTNLTLTSTATKAGYLAAAAGQYGVTLGHEAGRYAGVTLGMVALSPYAFLYTTNAEYGIAVGYASAQYNEDARRSLNLGVTAARFALSNIAAINLGYGAGRNSTNNSRSLNIGEFSGTNRDNTIWIDMSATSYGSVAIPFIYGEGDNYFLRLRANVSVLSNFYAGGVISGDGSGLTNVPAAGYTTGQLTNKVLYAGGVGVLQVADDSPGQLLGEGDWRLAQVVATNFAGNAENLTNGNATTLLATGTVPSDRLPTVWGGVSNAATSGTAVTVLANTNVGIGTAAPATRLEAVGAIRSSRSGASSQNIEIDASTTVGSTIISRGANKRLLILNVSSAASYGTDSFIALGNAATATGLTNYGLQVFTNSIIVNAPVGTVPSSAVDVRGTVTASNFVATGSGFHGVSNALTAWPTAPLSAGGHWIGNSNGVVYLLTSGLGLTWTSTNKLGP